MTQPRKASTDPTRHPWWQYIPEADRRTLMKRVRRRQQLEWLGRRRHRLLAVLLLYILLCTLPLLMGALPLTLIAMLPLLLLPALGGLAWWLTWKEFNQ